MPVQINELKVGGAAHGGSVSDIYLSVTTKRAGKIKGEATTEGHAGDITIHSMSWGVGANTAIGSSQATARRQYKHLTVVKGIDSATTPLMSALVSNDEVKEAKLTMRKAGGDALDYFTMTLNNARVVSVDIDVGPDGDTIERIGIAFTKIEIEYQPQQGLGIGSGSTTFSDEWTTQN